MSNVSDFVVVNLSEDVSVGHSPAPIPKNVARPITGIPVEAPQPYPT